jgi:hypothetical protein
MLQMSRPVQVLAIAAGVFAVAWFLFLRPKPAETPSTPSPSASAPTGPTGGAAGTGNANTTFGKAVDKAVQGANTASQDGARAAGTDPGATTPAPTAPGAAPTTSTPSTSSPTTPGTAPKPVKAGKGMPAPVAKALDSRKVVLLLFWNPTSADDKAVRRELRGVKRRGGKVYVASAPVSQLARYSGITQGVQVLQSPTIVIVDPNRKASTITGYTDATEIDQAVTDAIAASKKS